MANGFLGRFQGKIKVAQLWLASGANSIYNGIYDANTGIRIALGGGSRVPMVVTATSTTDFTLIPPPGASLASLTVYTTTGFGAATDAKISVGVTAGGQEIVAQTSIKAAGVVVLAFVASAAAAAAALSTPAAGFNVRITQTGTTSATGAATLVADYDMA